MAEVWVVEGGWDYEGFEIVSVHDSESGANYAATAAAKAVGYDRVVVSSYTVESAQDETHN